MRLLALFSALLSIILLSSCASPSGHNGYLTRPYTIRGQHYHPMPVEQALYHTEVGVASWYDESSWLGFKRGNTSLGEKVQPWHISGAHKTLPLPCEVKVTNLENGKTLKMRLNDRGPFIPGRIIDVTPRAAKKLDFHKDGLTKVKIEVLSVGDGKYKRKPKRKKRFLFF
ncbi:septal ring lytic transglycosylase RlpA family protein [Rubritalea spongiae]|uniref:Probable endolytic peptidoglycan transglycosylase RlpA n=1 Tax=Rubritalea spongiae TaxID=430797 RepID=A0ABW5E3U3_9BACT